MSSDLLSPPDLPMPPGRAEARRAALRRDLTSAVAVAPAPARRRTVRWKAAGALAAAAAVGGVFAVNGLTARTASPIASWTAIPTSLGRAAATAAEQQCQARLQAQHWPVTVSAMTGVLAEQRGRLTAVLLGGADQYGVCVGDPNDPVFIGVGEAGPFATADRIVLDGSPGKLNGTGPYRVAYGQVAPEVTAVLITTSDGRQVDATVAAGRFFAWWPSGADPKAITAYSAGGAVLRTLTPIPSDLAPSPVRRPGTS